MVLAMAEMAYCFMKVLFALVLKNTKKKAVVLT